MKIEKKNNNDYKIKIAIVISHPIQHFCPQYVSFSKNTDINFKVFFGSALGYKKYVDENFKQEIHWNNLNLDKFPHHFLNGEEIIQSDKNLDAPSLERELDEFNPDILFTYGYFQKLQRRAHKWALKNKVYMAYISDSELRHHSNPFKESLKGFFLRKYFSNMDVFLSMGNANEAYYTKFKVPPNKILRMHYPIDYEAYQKDFQEREIMRNKIRNQYHIGETDIALAVVGKLVPWKNQDHLIEAIKLLEAKGKTYHLFILGSGEKKEEWQQKAKGLKKNRIHFTGFVKAEELPGYLAASDIYVHPASLEPHSVAISEAIFMGCPIILSDRCGSYGPTDDVQIGKNGYVYKFGDIPELAEKIELLANNESVRKEFSAYSHEIAASFQENSHVTMMQKLVERFKKDHKQ